MKPLLLSTNDLSGGAARAVYRLHRGLRAVGVPSELLVQKKTSVDPNVHCVRPQTLSKRAATILRGKLDQLPLHLYRKRQRVPYHVQMLGERVRNTVDSLAPELLHLHWICGGFVRIESLPQLNKPLVWTMHDMWPFTGGCHVSNSCLRYMGNCGACPQLSSNRQRDLSRWVWRRKARAWKDLDLIIVSPSHWLAECARSSSLFKNRRIEVIPNAIDTTVFKPVDQHVMRNLLSLPESASLVLFGAMNTSNRWKGFHHLEGAIGNLAREKNNTQYEIVIFGASGRYPLKELLLPARIIGRVHDDPTLVALYNAANVMVVPSEQEAFGLTALEAMACGVPCVAFNIGGLPDMIDHKVNGYLAQPFDEQDLAEGIRWVLQDRERHAELKRRAREKVERQFKLDLMAQRYAALYDEILGAKPGTAHQQGAKEQA